MYKVVIAVCVGIETRDEWAPPTSNQKVSDYGRLILAPTWIKVRCLLS